MGGLAVVSNGQVTRNEELIMTPSARSWVCPNRILFPDNHADITVDI